MWDWPPQSPLVFFVVSLFDLGWTAMYILAIRRGFLDKTYGVPIVALFLNIAMDIINIFVVASPGPQLLVNITFLLLQLVMVYQVFRWWRTDFPTVPTWQFATLMLIGAVFGFLLIFNSVREFNESPAWRTSWIDTFINACLFIGMFYRRPDLRGQSLYIALLKWLSTWPLMLALYLYPPEGFAGSFLLPVLYLGIFILDLYYVVIVYLRSRALGLDTWRRA
jgi:hypothetical protein